MSATTKMTSVRSKTLLMASSAKRMVEPNADENAIPESSFRQITINEAQREELLRNNVFMITDANRVYQKKTAEMHRKIFHLEELFREYTIIKEQLQAEQSPSTSKKKKKIKSEIPTMIHQFSETDLADGVESSIDLDEIKTVEQAKEVYVKLLSDYLEHQAVLDQVVVEKQSRVNELEQELLRLGWVKPVNIIVEGAATPPPERKAKASYYSNYKNFIPTLKLRKTWATGTKAEKPNLPQDPSVSRVVKNKDLLQKKTKLFGTVCHNDFDIISVIGQGAFGKVYLVMKKQTGEFMAMKVMEKSSIVEEGDESLRHVIHELEFMRDMSHHPFIVSLYHAFQTDREVSLVMEWVGGGTLFDHLVKRDNPFSESEARFFAAQVLVALQSLHTNDIVYRDLKLENILVDETGYIRLSDFGLSARAKRGQKIHSFSGTATYLAPEIILDTGDDGHTHCVDLWCFGVMLFIMLTQEPPFWSDHYPDLFHLIKTAEIPFYYYEFLSPDAVNLLTGLLTKNPEERLGCGPRGIADVQDHPFFKSIEWRALLAKKISPPFKPNINRGKKLQSEEDKEPKPIDEQKYPAEIFKGFSFVWDPNKSEPEFLYESIDVLHGSAGPAETHKKRKNKIVVNFFLLIKEIQGLPATLIGKPVYIKWKHESKRHVTVIGRDEVDRVVDATKLITCKPDRSAQFNSAADNACIACDYRISQDRKTLAFDPRILTFYLLTVGKDRKITQIGKTEIDLSQFSFHKFENTQIFQFGDSGATFVLSILCSWKIFNGDYVNNYNTTG